MPGLLDTANVSTFTITVSDTESIGVLNLAGGSVTGSGSLLLNGSGSTWTAGNLNGMGLLTIGSSSSLSISNSGNHDFDGGTIVNNGTGSWTSGALRTGNGGSLTNNATWNDSATGSISNGWGNSATFTNATGANYYKTAGTTDIQIPFVNSGNVYVSGGTLNLDDGGTFGPGSTLNGSGGTLQTTGGTYAASGTLTVNAFVFNGGEITGTPTFSGTMTWLNGNFDSSGSTTITIPIGSTMTIGSSNDHDFLESAIINNGTVNWTGGQIRSGSGGSLTNNATWNDSASSVVTNAWGGNFSFTNSAGATYNVTAGTTNIDVPFVNSGRVSVGAGGAFYLNAGGTLAGGSVLSGSGGPIELTAGTFSASGTLSIANVDFTGGSIAGTPTFSGTMNWSNGNMDSAGATSVTFDASSTLTISSSNAHDFDGSSIANYGITSWTGGQIRSGSGGMFTNLGTFNDSASNSINDAWDNNFSFVNASGATYNKMASGTTNMAAFFANSGSVNVNSGTLDLTLGGSNASSAAVTTSSGAVTEFGSGTFTVAAGSSFGGSGLYELTGGTLALSGGVSFGRFLQSGGHISGAMTLNSTQFEWSGGDWDAVTTGTVGGTSTLTIDTANDHDFDTATLVNAGTVNWTAGQIRTGNGGSFTNNGTWNDSATNSMNNAWGGSATFTNSSGAIYNKTAGTTDIDIQFVNSGTVNVTNGVFNLNDGATLNGGSSLSGSGGVIQLTSGSFAANGAVAIANVSLTGGEITGMPVFSGTMNWQGGDMDSPGTTTVTFDPRSTLTISTSNDHDFLDSEIINNGIVDWTGGQLRTGNGGSFTNNGTFNDSSSNYITNAWGGSATFTNASGAVYNKTAAGTTYVQVSFANSGTVSVQAGSLLLQGGGSNISPGSISTASGATTEFDGGTFTAGSNSVFGGAGAYVLAGGLLSLTGQVTFGTITQGGGELSGTMTFVSTGYEWSAGDWDPVGTATFDSASTLTIDTTNYHDFDGATVLSSGTVNWTGGQLRTGNGGSFTNNGTFNDSASNYITNPWGGSATFTNAPGAVYNKTAAGTTYVQIPFANSGSVSVQSGTLEFQDGGSTTSPGSFSTASGAVTEFGSGTFTAGSGSIFSGAGRYEITGGILSLSGSVTMESALQSGGELSGTMAFAGTSFEWSAGDWDLAGTVAFNAASTLTIDTTNYHDFDGSTVLSSGTANWTGGQLRTGSGGSFTNNGTFNDSASNYITNPWGGSATFTNAPGAVYNKTAAGTTYVQIPFANSGSVSVQSGTLEFQDGGSTTSPGSFSTASGAVTEFGSGTFTAGAGSIFGGTGLYNLAGGTLSLAGATTAASLIQTGGELGGTVAFNSTAYEWSAGDWDLARTVTFDVSSTLTIDTTNYHDFDGATVVSNGTVNWTGGQLRTGSGGSFTNNGTFNDSASNSVNNPWGGSATFTNASGATYVHMATGTTTFSGVPFANSGWVSVTAGAVSFAGGFTNTNGSLSLSGGSAIFPSAADFTTGSVIGNGAVTATMLTVGGTIAPGANSGSGLLTVNGALTLLGSSEIEFNIGGTAPGTQFDQVAVTGAATLNGYLTVSLNNAFQNSITPSETFQILSSSTLSGSFLNAANGSQVAASGLGWFTVNYGPSSPFSADDVVLSDFTPVPEPTSLEMMAGAAAGLAALLRFRRRGPGKRIARARSEGHPRAKR